MGGRGVRGDVGGCIVLPGKDVLLRRYSVCVCSRARERGVAETLQINE